MRNIEIMMIAPRHTRIKIQFDRKTMKSGIRIMSTWNRMTVSPDKIVSSYFVYRYM